MAALFILLGLAAAIFGVYLLVTWKFNYWKKKKVPHLKPLPLFGNYKDYITLNKTVGEVAQSIARQFQNEPYIGTYYGTEPALLVQDPEIIKLIMTKDYAYFSSREIAAHTEKEVVGRNMFFAYGDKWKVLRQNISPLFTVSKIKNMFPLVQECVPKFEKMLEHETSISKELDIRFTMSRFMMECISSVAFGVEANVMNDDVANNSFKMIGDKTFEISNARGIAWYSRAIWPTIFYGLGLNVFPKFLVDFFNNLIKDVMKNRDYKPSSRNDFVDMLLNIRNNGELTCESILKSSKGEKVRIKVDDDLLAAQCLLFFAAGFETSASATSFALYQLAAKQEAQKRAIEEVDSYLKKREGKIEYDCVSELPYLEACVDEAMRLAPALGLLTREVLEPYQLPTGLKLEKGIRIHLPIYHLHRHPLYFPDPETFKPERFLPENKDKIVPYTYMPFGEGQRICMGMRVAKMQMMPGLVTVLRHYRLELAEEMPAKVVFEPRAIVTTPNCPLRVKFIPRN